MTFLRAVVNQIRSQYCVNADRIYAEGGSFGGFMAQRLACDAEDLFASVATTISGSISPCTLSRPVSVAIVNSENDPIFPLATAAVPNRNLWIARNGCSSTPTADPNPYGLNGAVYGGCNAGVGVLWRTYTGLGHGYPTDAALTDFQNHVWSFLMSHPKS